MLCASTEVDAASYDLKFVPLRNVTPVDGWIPPAAESKDFAHDPGWQAPESWSAPKKP